MNAPGEMPGQARKAFTDVILATIPTARHTRRTLDRRRLQRRHASRPPSPGDARQRAAP